MTATHLNDAYGILGAPTPRRTVWLDHPANLYATDDQALMYLRTVSSAQAGFTFHGTIRKLLREHAPELCSGFGRAVEFVDLGPGYPDKTLPLLRYMRSEGIRGAYVPVDINRTFLKLAVNAGQPFGFSVHPMNVLFENLPDASTRRGNRYPRLVMMGVTFMNYRPRDGCRLLSRLLGSGDAALLAVELFDGSRLDKIVDPYGSEEARDFNFAVLQRLGVSVGDVRYFAEFVRQRVEMGFVALRTIHVGKDTVSPGDRIVTSFSYRHDSATLKCVLRRHFGSVEFWTDKRGSCAVVRVRR